MSLNDDSDRSFKLASDGGSGAGAEEEEVDYDQFAPPLPGADRWALCRWCPCAHIQMQLGLQALDNNDALRVWLRFASIVIMSTSFVYFLLLMAFTRWFNFAGAIALLTLTLCVSFLTALFGLWASRRRPFESSLTPSTFLGSSSSSSAGRELSLELSEQHAVAERPGPRFPIALALAKWLCVLPLSLLCFFLAAWLGCAMVGMLQFGTDLTASSRQQTMSVLLLGFNSLVTLTAQCFLFLVASSMQQPPSDSDDSSDLDWHERQLREVAPEVGEAQSQLDRDEALQA